MKLQKKFIPLTSSQKSKKNDSPNHSFNTRQIMVSPNGKIIENLDSMIIKKNVRNTLEKTCKNSPMTVKNLIKKGNIDAAMIMFENSNNLIIYFLYFFKLSCHVNK